MRDSDRGFWTGVIDWSAAVFSAGCFIQVLFDTQTVVRAVVALALVLFLPGWTVLRLAGVRLSGFMVVGAVVISMSIVMLLSLILVTRTDWAWRAGALGLSAACAIGLAAIINRDDLSTVRA